MIEVQIQLEYIAITIIAGPLFNLLERLEDFVHELYCCVSLVATFLFE